MKMKNLSLTKKSHNERQSSWEGKTYFRKHMHASICIYIYLYVCIPMYKFTCIYTPLYMYMCVYIYIVAQLVKNLPAMGRPGFDPWIGKIPWRRERPPTPVVWPGEFHGLYSPWGHKESNTAEWLSHFHINLCKSATKHEITS